MPPWETPAIVLSVKDFGEADRVVTFLTPERGRLTGIAKHARKSRRRFVHCLEPFSRVTFFLSDRPRGELEFLEKGETVWSSSLIRRDLARLGAAAVLGETAGELASPPEAGGPIFATLEEALHLLDAGAPPASVLPVFLTHLLKVGGYGLALTHCLSCGQEPRPPLLVSLPRGGILCGSCGSAEPGPLVSLEPGTWKLLRLALELPLNKIGRLRIPGPQSRQAILLLRLFCRHYLGRELKTWAFWDKVNPAGALHQPRHGQKL